MTTGEGAASYHRSRFRVRFESRVDAAIRSNWDRNFAAAARFAKGAIDAAGRVDGPDRSETAFSVLLARATRELADATRQLTGPGRAYRIYRSAVDMARQAFEADPSNPLALRELAAVLNRLYRIELELGHPRNGLAAAAESARLLKRMWRRSIAEWTDLRDLALAYRNEAECLIAIGKPRAALGPLRLARIALHKAETVQTKAEQDPLRRQQNLLMNEGRLAYAEGEARAALRDSQAALKALRSAHRSFARACGDRFGANTHILRYDGRTLGRLGELLASAGRANAARRAFTSADRLLQWSYQRSGETETIRLIRALQRARGEFELREGEGLAASTYLSAGKIAA